MPEPFEILRRLVERNRSYRRFQGDFAVERHTLEELVALARNTASAANLQPIRFLLSWETGRNALIYPHLAWAAYLKDWPGPAASERPSAYIVLLGDLAVAKNFATDAGIVAQTLLLGATALGLGGCILGSISRQTLAAALSIPDRYEILLVTALGRPAETVVLENASSEADVRYWRDEAGIHHVPKRPLEELIIEP